MFSQHRHILVFKGLLLMMLHLLFNVSNHSVLGREANREGSVTILPAKLADQTTRVIDVFTGVGFELSNKFGDCDLRWNTSKWA